MCDRVHTIATLPYGADRRISIRRHHSCQSASVVYLISCTKAQCDAVYIGETGGFLRETMNGHRSSIKNNEDTPIAVHLTHRGKTSCLYLTKSFSPVFFGCQRLIIRQKSLQQERTSPIIVNVNVAQTCVTVAMVIKWRPYVQKWCSS